MNKYVKVENNSSLVRDKASGAIVNINSEEISRAKKRKYKASQERKEIESLRDEVKEMKHLLMKVLEEKNGDNNH